MNEITRTGYKRRGSEKGPEREVESKQFWILCRFKIMFLIKVFKSSKEDWIWAKENRGRHSTGLVPSTFLRAEENSRHISVCWHMITPCLFPVLPRPRKTFDLRQQEWFEVEWQNKLKLIFKRNFYLVLWCHWSIVILH